MFLWWSYTLEGGKISLLRSDIVFPDSDWTVFVAFRLITNKCWSLSVRKVLDLYFMLDQCFLNEIDKRGHSRPKDIIKTTWIPTSVLFGYHRKSVTKKTGGKTFQLFREFGLRN